MLALTLREFDLLAYLLRHPGRVFTREELIRGVWGWDFGDLLSRIHAGSLTLSPTRISAHDLVGDALAGADPLAREHGVRLVGDRVEAVPVEVDGKEMSRVLGNLLINAIRRTPADGTVAVAAHRTGGGVVLSVTDGCGGIPEEELPRVFDTGGAAAMPVRPRPVRGSDWPSCAGPSRRTSAGRRSATSPAAAASGDPAAGLSPGSRRVAARPRPTDRLSDGRTCGRFPQRFRREPGHSLGEPHFRLPAQFVAQPPRVRRDMAYVPEPELTGHHRRRATVGRGKGRGHLADGVRLSAPGVVRGEAARKPSGDRLQRHRIRGRHVPYMDEVPALAAILEDPGRLPRARAERKKEATPAYGVSRGIPGPYTLW